ncbi:MAG: terpene cyclase/mutase family protein [Planctomycetaceae bacterium]|jgi:hypothetical protein|nr:terpene cyclase/mutase family protein [Planctomycetaceae bacterium]
MADSEHPENRRKTPDEEPAQRLPEPPPNLISEPVQKSVPPLFHPPTEPPTLPDEEFASSCSVPSPNVPPPIEKSTGEETVFPPISPKRPISIPELDRFFSEKDLRKPPVPGRVRIIPPVIKKEDLSESDWRQRLRKLIVSRFSVSGLVSLIVHILLIFLLMLIVSQINNGNRGISIIGGTTDVPLPIRQVEIPLSPQTADSHPLAEETVTSSIPQMTMTEQKPTPSANLSQQSSNAQQILQDIGDLAASITPSSGGSYASRTEAGKTNLLNKGRISQAGENAVEAGLRWLAAHQFPDGGWDFRLHSKDAKALQGGNPPCPELCEHPGTHRSRNAATGLALLAFLGAGHTHLSDNPYKHNIERALIFLRYNAKTDSEGRKDFQENTEKGMYAQGITVMALCEAYGMTKDRSFLEEAQRGLDFIVWAQNRDTGGWRYVPFSEGGGSDTTVTAWQFMALKSGKISGLNVPEISPESVGYYLDTVITPGTYGSEYSYMSDHAARTDESHRATTAMGLLLRMYLGWRPENRTLRNGVLRVYEWGPSYLWTSNDRYKNGKSCLYYDYYATLLLHHYGSGEWDRFYRDISRHLMTHQAKTGHESGSWYFPDQNGDVGGRLLNTCLAVMILEVPYRYMPLYQNIPPF